MALSTPALVAKNKKPLRILAFGDSLTAGYRQKSEESYPSLLEKKFLAEGYAVKVINAGVSGDTTRQGLQRVDWALKNGPFDVVLLGLGANDGLRQLPLKDMEKNLESIIRRFKDKKVKVILLGMKIPTNFPAPYRKAFEGAYLKLSKKEKISLYPFFLDGIITEPGSETLRQDDGIHPNAVGYLKIVEKLYPFVKKEVF